MSINDRFDEAISKLALNDDGTSQIEKCMKFDQNLSRNVPLRHKIITTGFVRRYSLEELNANLQKYNLDKLYARNLWEATLIYAFSKHLTYHNWRQKIEIVRSLNTNITSSILINGRLTTNTIKEYLDDNSIQQNSEAHITNHVTQRIEDDILQLNNDNEFINYITSNINEFSKVREKTRYYFCKYLYHYLKHKVEVYLFYKKQGITLSQDELMSEFSIFQGIREIHNSDSAINDILEELLAAPISFRNLHRDFNEFYWGYVRLDWFHAFLNVYDDFNNLSNEDVKKIAAAAKAYDSTYRKQNMEDMDIVKDIGRRLEQHEKDLDKLYSRGTANRGYQYNRSEESILRSYMTGELDLDRTTFICLLIFLSDSIPRSERIFLDENRLNVVLVESGFQELQLDDSFDQFVHYHLENTQNSDYLEEGGILMKIEENVEQKLVKNKKTGKYTVIKENCILYNIYRKSRSNNKDFNEMIRPIVV